MFIMDWSPVQFMNESGPHYVYLLVYGNSLDSESFNHLMQNMSEMNARPLSEDNYAVLLFSHEGQAALSRRLFAGVSASSSVVLLLISDSPSMPKDALNEHQDRGEGP
jgi:hypothetical protein